MTQRMRLPTHPKPELGGITIIELLIAGFVLTIVLGLGSVFLAQQTVLQRAVQARNDVQDRVRVVMQVVSQDLTLAGNSTLVNPDGSQRVSLAGLCRNVLSPDDPSTCIVVSPDGANSVLRLRYLSSQFAASSECRDVTYRVLNGALLRSDVACNLAGALGSGAEAPADFGPALAFDVRLVCSDGAVVGAFDAVADCGGASYPRSAIVTYASESEVRTRGSAATELSSVVPAGNVNTNSTATLTVQCDAGSVCSMLTQEVLMPNLKDQ